MAPLLSAPRRSVTMSQGFFIKLQTRHHSDSDPRPFPIQPVRMPNAFPPLGSASLPRGALRCWRLQLPPLPRPQETQLSRLVRNCSNPTIFRVHRPLPPLPAIAIAALYPPSSSVPLTITLLCLPSFWVPAILWLCGLLPRSRTDFPVSSPWVSV